jgi:hypothetical protein
MTSICTVVSYRFYVYSVNCTPKTSHLAHHAQPEHIETLSTGGSGTFAHVYVYSTQCYYQMSNYSGTSSTTCPVVIQYLTAAHCRHCPFPSVLSMSSNFLTYWNTVYGDRALYRRNGRLNLKMCHNHNELKIICSNNKN